MDLKVFLPIKTISEANSCEHWSKKHKRHKLQKKIISLSLRNYAPPPLPPIEIILTRISPRFLDSSDNLPASFKWILDEICNWIYPGLQAGRADSKPGIFVKYLQEKGKVKEYAVKIEIKSL